MVVRNKEGIEIANKRSLRIYIRKTYDARIDGEEEGVHLEKTYIIQFLKVLMKLVLLVKRKQQMLKMKMQTKMRTLLQKPMLVMRMNSKILMMQINLYCEC